MGTQKKLSNVYQHDRVQDNFFKQFLRSCALKPHHQRINGMCCFGYFFLEMDSFRFNSSKQLSLLPCASEKDASNIISD